MSDILTSLNVLFQSRKQNESIEIRALRPNGPPEVGYYTDLRKCAEDVEKMEQSGKFRGIYSCLNGRTETPPRANSTARGISGFSDDDIENYYWFWVDFDSARADTHEPASEKELEASRQEAFRTLKALREGGWPKPYVAMSGNGYHLLWPLGAKDDPGVPASLDFSLAYQNALKVLNDRFSETIDLKIFNPSRICRLYGTTARKGTSTPDRPHRQARILNPDLVPEYLTRTQVEELANQRITKDQGEESDVKLAKLIDWMGDNFPEAKGPRNYLDGGKKWVFEVCPWNSEHRDSSAFVVRFPSGAMVAGCLHNSCPGSERDADGRLTGWKSLQEKCGKPLTGRNANLGPSTAQAPGRTDLGNAKRLVTMYGNDARYIPEIGRWMFWGNNRWLEDSDGRIVRCAAGVAAAVFAAAAQEPDPDEAAACRKWAVQSESAGRMKSCIELAASEPGISVPIDHFDRDHWLLGTQTGVLDLRTGKVAPFAREQYITKVSPVLYDPTATCPQWDAFINEIFGGDKEMIAFVYRALGYSLTGVANEQVMFFAHGLGANGKSTMMSVVQYILGDYARLVDSTMLMASRGDQHTTGLTDLKGLRFAVASETDKAKHFAEATIKKITGEEKITARRMRQDNMTFEATHKLWMLTNHRPIIKGNDEGIWRRIIYVPFEVVIPKERRDPGLLTKLKEESSGVLNRLIEGCRDWMAQGLNVPSKARAQVEDYKHEMDPLAEFFEDCCILAPTARVAMMDLFEAFCAWSAERRQQVTTYKYFNRLMRERGYSDNVDKVQGKSIRVWRGITLNEHVVIGITVDPKDWGRAGAEE